MTSTHGPNCCPDCGCQYNVAGINPFCYDTGCDCHHESDDAVPGGGTS